MTASLRSFVLRAAPLAVATAAFASIALEPAVVQACGGTFCDGGNGPNPMPVEQTGETIIFNIDDDEVEAHIQIYVDENTNAERFAWIIPVPELPEFEVGSERLFQNVLQATNVSYGQSSSNQFCGDFGDSTAGESGTSGDDGGWGDTGDSTDSGDPEDPEVVLEETMGAFDIVVLSGGTVETVMQWLADNDYEQNPDSGPILQEYLDEGMLFVALRLTPQAGLDSVHPIVIRYPGNEPCIPLRLTAIAAVDDMDIRAYFFGNERVVPTSYKHVVLNNVRMDWGNPSTSYRGFVGEAIDEAGGRAFITEYAGFPSIVNTFGLWDSNWNADRFATMQDSPEEVIPELTDQGLWANFSLYPEEGTHPLISGILQEFLPVPGGVAPEDFWACVQCYEGLIDSWDAQGFADALQERIITPGLRAESMVEDSTYLTGLYTRISPDEMLEDPMFTTNNDLPMQTTQVWNASRTDFDNGNATTSIPMAEGGNWQILGQSGVWPSVPGQPFAERIEIGTSTGPMQVEQDNLGNIQAAIVEWNSEFGEGCDNEPGGGETGADPDGGEDAGDSETGAGADGGADGEDMGGKFGGCACSAGDDGGNPLGLAVGLMVLGLVRRRRSA